MEVTCRAPSADRLRISVQDTGKGLSAEQCAQLFQPFNRLGQEASGEEGTGIGLVVSKRLVELMSGVIGVESIVGVGSSFWIELPATSAVVVEPPHVEQAGPGAAAALAAAHQLTLLYVEDNPANLKLIEQLVARRPDLRLLTAGDADFGIQLARSALPDVILMDINLPGINGFDAMEILRHDRTTAHIPVIALSANAMPRDVERGMKAGFFSYLTKPVKVPEFLETLAAALELASRTK